MGKVELTYGGVFFDQRFNVPLVVLEGNNNRGLIIHIGPNEAAMIYHFVKGESKRPTSHDLVVDSLSLFGSKIDLLELESHSEGVFRCWMHVKKMDGQALSGVDGQDISKLDARPSDGIGIMLRYQCTMQCDDELFDEFSVDLEETLGKDNIKNPMQNAGDELSIDEGADGDGKFKEFVESDFDFSQFSKPKE